MQAVNLSKEQLKDLGVSHLNVTETKLEQHEEFTIVHYTLESDLGRSSCAYEYVEDEEIMKLTKGNDSAFKNHGEEFMRFPVKSLDALEDVLQEVHEVIALHWKSR